MKQLACAAFILTVFVTLHACNQNRKARNFNNTVDAEAQNFITKGIESSNAEVQLSQLALKASKNKLIIDYAKMMIAGHTEAGNELTKIAAGQSASVPDTLTKVHTQVIQGLGKKSGNDFDKDYIQAMVQDHEQTIALFKTVTGNPNKKLTDFADKTLPDLKEHLKKANEICAGLK